MIRLIWNFFVLGTSLFILLLPRATEAGFITIETDVQASVGDSTGTAKIRVTNKGDEAAYNIRISADIGGNVKKGPLQEILKPNHDISETITAPVDYKKPGRYPVIVWIDYTDQNQYPFTAISIVYLNFQEPVVGRVVGEMPPLEMEDRGNLRVKVKNLEQNERDIKVRLVVPEEFSSSSSRQEIRLKPGAEETLSFELRNVSALAGSSYQVYTLLQYEDQQYHYANAIGSIVAVQATKTFFERYQKPLIGIAIVLAILVAYFNLRRRQTG
jgi:hypothetical protein